MARLVRPKLGDVLPGVMLYVINIYQPCTKYQISKALATASKSEQVPISAKSAAFVQALQWLIENKHVGRIDQEKELYVVLPDGLRFLSKQRLAFLRDKFRLYFVHQQLRNGRRNQKDKRKTPAGDSPADNAR